MKLLSPEFELDLQEEQDENSDQILKSMEQERALIL